MVAGATDDDWLCATVGWDGVAGAYAPSTWAVLRASPTGTCASSTRSPPGSGPAWPGGLPADAPLATRRGRGGDVDDTNIEVHGHAKQGSGYGYTRSAASRAAGHRQHPGSAPVTWPSGAQGRPAPRGGPTAVADALKTPPQTGGDSASCCCGPTGLLRPDMPGRRARRRRRDGTVRRPPRSRPRAHHADNARTPRVPGRAHDEPAARGAGRGRRSPVRRAPQEGRPPGTRPAACDASPTRSRGKDAQDALSTPALHAPPPPTPRTWTRSPRTRPTAATPSRTSARRPEELRPAHLPPARSTPRRLAARPSSPRPHPSRSDPPAPGWPRRPPRPSAAPITVPARIASSARRSCCTCPSHGPGSTPGPRCHPQLRTTSHHTT